MVFDQTFGSRQTVILFGILSGLAYLILSYFIPRQETVFLIGTMVILFLGYFFAVSYTFSTRQLLILGLIFRLIPIFSIPQWSDDFYRFLWDGYLWNEGINPFAHIPVSLEATLPQGHPPVMAQLLSKMNSPEYYAIYPPVNQWIFSFAARFGNEGYVLPVIIIRLALLTGEIFLFFQLQKLLRYLSISRSKLSLYWLNPLIIMEVSHNLHFEGLMFLFMVAFFVTLIKEQWLPAGIFLSLAICTKLIPLIFFPFLLRYLKIKPFLILSGITAVLCFIYFIPFLDNTFLTNFSSSLDLYFRKFEFNASLFYVFRWIGFQVKGYDIIQTLGPILALVTMGVTLFLSLRKKQHLFSIAEGIQLSLLVYYLLAPIVHPWYIITLCGLSVITRKMYPIAWSFGAILSYYFYRNFEESSWLLALEYILVIGFFLYEYGRKRTPKKQELA